MSRKIKRLFEKLTSLYFAQYKGRCETLEKVINYINEGKFDLLVIGFMGHSKIFGRIWGSTSQTITRLAPCTVMVVK
ncbi:MAG: universal stress protein [Ignavibacteriales bacterium]